MSIMLSWINNIEKETKNTIMVGVTQIHKIVRKVVCQKTKKYAFLQFQIRQVAISGWQPWLIFILENWPQL